MEHFRLTESTREPRQGLHSASATKSPCFPQCHPLISLHPLSTSIMWRRCEGKKNLWVSSRLRGGQNWGLVKMRGWSGTLDADPGRAMHEGSLQRAGHTDHLGAGQEPPRWHPVPLPASSPSTHGEHVPDQQTTHHLPILHQEDLVLKALCRPIGLRHMANLPGEHPKESVG